METSAPLAATEAFEGVVGLVGRGGVVVLSGAGLSTESGIPDYRGETGRSRKGVPMTYQQFTGSAADRRRYWARSHLGWTTIAGASPNPGHQAVARLAHAGFLTGIITQNVDGLHGAAGTPDAVELHGSLHRVVCLGCGDRTSRRHLDELLDQANPGFRGASAQVNPDGDADLPLERVAAFRTVACQVCRTGTLKPDVVFFGESVPKNRVARCFELVDAASAVLVLGSSLTVMSGLRFVRYAAKQGKPVAIVNQGPTRGDDLAALRVPHPLGAVLSRLAARLGV
ncbi:NAD-dependent protein deacetylase [Actinacidiphila acidipaludis]|uniref:NAD-dependent protein deacetylase n=1 Tax=Actinacidiphila acidipaludis TaxID=2873382 RepID=A0ABS7Q6R9_9ACTN|nr:NAD-dependent protein deacetylase [Streptomyces acidipaludis]MBY8878846.1 NAD-dependent protein deacetylase [Streptomyces acidipaludis]